MIKAIGFDVGHTLIDYKNPLSWSSLYVPALEHVSQRCNLSLSTDMISSAVSILTKYNTRVNPRDIEVSSDIIFHEIFSSWKLSDIHTDEVKDAFYSFFQADAVPFYNTITVLRSLKQMNIQTGILTDVAYGMEHKYALRDLSALTEYIDITLTSVDVGFRKPHPAGFLRLLQHFGITPDEMIYIGDEEKDIVGANALGIHSVLINRSSTNKAFQQKHTIADLSELLDIVTQYNAI